MAFGARASGFSGLGFRALGFYGFWDTFAVRGLRFRVLGSEDDTFAGTRVYGFSGALHPKPEKP